MRLALIRRPTPALWLLALFASLAALWAGRGFAVTVLSAVALAVLLWPLQRRVQAVLRVRVLAAVLVLGVATAASLGLATLAATQLSAIGQRLPDALRLAARDVDRLDGMGAATVQRTRSALAELDRTVARVTGTPPSRPAAVAAPASGSLVASAVERSAEGMLHVGRAGFALVLQAGVIVMLAFFLLCSGDRLAHGLSRWVDGRPLARGRFSPLVSALAREVRRYGAVTLVTNVLIGLAVAAGAAAFGVTSPGSWGLLAATLHLVPYAGLAATMAVLGLEVYVLHGSAGLALLSAAFVALVGLVVGSALATWLQGRASRIDSALMFAGTVFFAVLWGGWGLVLGPLMVVMVHAGMQHLRAPALAAAAVEALPEPPAVGVPALTGSGHS
ncbi:MAG: AI-2E family transporter [Rubrivivax sp.]|nr:AI-2E family transporter [Rubrivivax sp.]